MDEDIDIEEHDLLDNPAIKKIFPDLSILKQEISGYCDEATDIKQDPDALKDIGALNASSLNNNDAEEINNISENSDMEPEIIFVDKREPPLYSNKIILGSKPVVQCKTEKESENITEKIYSARINLVDIGSYLDKSEKYCSMCHILFPQLESLQFHNAETHHKTSRYSTKKKLVHSTYKCDKCLKVFTRYYNLLRHLRNFHHTSKPRLLNSNKVLHQISQTRKRFKPEVTQSGKQNRCFHCKKIFSSNKLLIEHIYMVLRTNKKMNDNGIRGNPKLLGNNRQPTSRKSFRLVFKKRALVANKKNTVKMGPNSTFLYRCLYCSYYLTHFKFYLKHLKNKHKDFNGAKVKMKLFDGQCKYCSLNCINWKSFNVHLQMCHKEKVNNIFKVNPKIVLPRLEVTLTERLNVDKNVLDVVLNEPNEFDEEDDEIKEIDAFVPSENEGGESSVEENSVKDSSFILKSVLFKCIRCDIHFFTAKFTMNHTDHMEMLINWKCHICQKIFKKHDQFAHEKQHEYSCNFAVIDLVVSELDRVLYKCSKCAIHFCEDNYLPHFSTCDQLIAESVYCKVCDFLIDKRISDCHYRSHRLNKLKPMNFIIINSDVITFKINGNSNSKPNRDDTDEIVNPTLKNTKHCPAERKGRIKRTMQMIYRGIYLKLSYCESCKSFVTKVAILKKMHLEARCTHMRTIVCNICGLVFTHNSIKGHRKLHQKKDVKLQDFKFYSMESGKQIIPPVPQYPKCYKCDVHFISKVGIYEHVCSDNFLTCHICNVKLSEPVFKLHMSFHYYSEKQDNNLRTIISYEHKVSKHKKSNISKDPGAAQYFEKDNSLNESSLDDKITSISLVSKKNSQASNEIKLNAYNEINANISDAVRGSKTFTDHKVFDILYFCANCHTTIDTYDKVVVHCQDHLCGVNIDTDRCEMCNAVFERRNHDSHFKSHSKIIKKEVNLLTFDIFYFTLGDRIWVQHIFGSISDKRAKAILNQSIYRDCKLRMKVLQDGLAELTVYKCNSCCIIVESDSLLKHAETSCFKNRKYPCSFCGLPFSSYLARQVHENIHKTGKITLKSYRIVTFNRENDKRDNKVLTKPNNLFFLYQCRNCNGVIDKYQRSIHKCVVNDLKTCQICELLIPSSDYKAHCGKHDKIPIFIRKNMKVVLFGQSNLTMSDIRESGSNGISTYLDDTFIDYTFYRCVDCEVCFDKSQISRLKHNACYDNALKSYCSQCNLYIAKKNMLSHIKFHERYDDFERENINVIPYSANELQANFVPANKYHPDDDDVLNTQNKKEQELPQDIAKHAAANNEKDVNETDTTQNITLSERTAKLLKCVCGTHFLDISSIQDHFNHCHPRIAKQSCSKCNLLFTPNVLFNHLLLHHGDKKYYYKFNIIEMSKKKCDIVTLYNCANCNTHFDEYENAKAHFDICLEVDKEDTEKCKKCNLFFDNSSIKIHERDHHKDSVADINIIDIETILQEIHTKGSQPDKSNVNSINSQADFVIGSKKYNLSKDTLSRINMNRYNNCIYKCEICNTHFLSESTHKIHFAKGHIISPQDTCHICGLKFSLLSLTKHIYIHHEQLKLNIGDFVFK